MKKLFLLLGLVLAIGSPIFGFEYNRTPAGLIQGARLARVSDTAIQVGVGYGDIMGSYWEISPASTLISTGYTLTSLTANTFQYIYIDRSNSSLPSVALRNSTTAPTWSNDFMGWYDNFDRCIGAVWIDSNAKIVSFYCSQDDTYIAQVGRPVVNATVSTTDGIWNTVDITSYAPVNASEVSVQMTCYHATGTVWTYGRVGIYVTGYLDGTEAYDNGVKSVAVSKWLPFQRYATKNVSWLASASHSATTASMKVRGYKLER